jgi:hypothetical protein
MPNKTKNLRKPAEKVIRKAHTAANKARRLAKRNAALKNPNRGKWRELHAKRNRLKRLVKKLADSPPVDRQKQMQARAAVLASELGVKI